MKSHDISRGYNAVREDELRQKIAAASAPKQIAPSKPSLLRKAAPFLAFWGGWTLMDALRNKKD